MYILGLYSKLDNRFFNSKEEALKYFYENYIVIKEDNEEILNEQFIEDKLGELLNEYNVEIQIKKDMIDDKQFIVFIKLIDYSNSLLKFRYNSNGESDKDDSEDYDYYIVYEIEEIGRYIDDYLGIVNEVIIKKIKETYPSIKVQIKKINQGGLDIDDNPYVLFHIVTPDNSFDSKYLFGEDEDEYIEDLKVCFKDEISGDVNIQDGEYYIGEINLNKFISGATKANISIKRI